MSRLPPSASSPTPVSKSLALAGKPLPCGINSANVGLVSDAVHGSKAARASGLNSGSWQVSAVWQRQDTVPGERWEVTGHVQHPAAKPLVGANIALVNIEWRDAAGALIDYESFTVADTLSPTPAHRCWTTCNGIISSAAESCPSAGRPGESKAPVFSDSVRTISAVLQIVSGLMIRTGCT
jgi:hypothetical protein